MESAADTPRETNKTPQQAAFFHLKTHFLEILELSPCCRPFYPCFCPWALQKKEQKKKASLSPSSSGADSAAGKAAPEAASASGIPSSHRRAEKGYLSWKGEKNTRGIWGRKAGISPPGPCVGREVPGCAAAPRASPSLPSE